MKSVSIFVFLLATASIANAAPDFTAWRWEQSVEVTAPGMARLDLPPATLDASQPSLADLRLISPDEVETPWLLENTVPPRVAEHRTTDFRASLVERNTVITASHDAGAFESVTLQSPSRGFLKAVQIEASHDGQTWEPIATGEIIFRQAGGAERLRVPVTPGDWRQVRVKLDDDRSPPVAFTGMSVTPVTERAETQELKTSITSRIEADGETRITLGLGAKNLHLAELSLDVPDGVFNRHCKVSVEDTHADKPPTLRQIGSGTIYRVFGGNDGHVDYLTLALHQRVPTDSLVLTITNDDSPPLDIRSVTASRYPDRLLFFAKPAGTWTLLTGNRHASAPRYDLASLRDRLMPAPANPIIPGPLTARQDYQAPPTLPEVEPSGSEIDLSDWGRRRAVNARLPGVVRIELDTTALSHLSHMDLGDLRLIQNGRQVPWLREPKPRLHSLSPQVTDDPDPKLPTRSRWKITTPSPGLPLHQIQIGSPDPLFTRNLRFIQRGKDELGNPWSRTLTTVSWTRTPNGGDSGKTLTVPLGDVRISDALWIETDNGDNPPIRLENVVLLYRAPAIIAKIADSAPLFLYYDNPGASSPVYDLGLVSQELLAADRQTAALGDEEILEPGKKRGERDLSAGSPWLWAALALVVVVLLFIVAKMLPKEAKSETSDG